MEESQLNGGLENGQITSDTYGLEFSSGCNTKLDAVAANATDNEFAAAEVVTPEYGDNEAASSLVNGNENASHDTLCNGSYEPEPCSPVELPSSPPPQSDSPGEADVHVAPDRIPDGLDDGSREVKIGDSQALEPVTPPQTPAAAAAAAAADLTPVSPALVDTPVLSGQHGSDFDPSLQFSPGLSNGELLDSEPVDQQQSDAANPETVKFSANANESGEQLPVAEQTVDATSPTDQQYAVDAIDQTLPLTGNDSAAVTPMDEYRHLLKQNETVTPSFSPADQTGSGEFTPTAKTDEFSAVLASPPVVSEVDASQQQIQEQPCPTINVSAENAQDSSVLETNSDDFQATMADLNADVSSTSEISTTLPDDAAAVSSGTELSGTDPNTQTFQVNQLSPSNVEPATSPAVDTPVSPPLVVEDPKLEIGLAMTYSPDADNRDASKDVEVDTVASSSLLEQTVETTRTSNEVNIENTSSSVTSSSSPAVNVDQLPQHSEAIDVFQPPQEQPQPDHRPDEPLLQQQQHQPDVSLQPQAPNAGLDNRQRPLLLPLSIKTDFPAKSSAEVLSQSTGGDSEVFAAEPAPVDASVSPSSSVPVNRQSIEKVAPPEIARTVRHMFESGEMADRHQVPKRLVRIEDDLLPASCSGVFENQPSILDDDVVRETGEYISPRAEVQQGLTKSLLSQWQAKENQEFRIERRPIVLAEAEGQVLENEPAQQRPDVVREDYRDPAAELPAPGQAKLLLQRFTSPNQDSTPKKDAKAAILAEVAAAAESGTPSVIENVPDRRPDVLREEDTTEEVWLRKGYTRDLAGFWSSPQQRNENQGPRQPIELPRDEAARSVFENQPSKLDDSVVRAGEYVEETVAVEKGRAKSMVNMWQNRQDDSPAKPRQPIQLVADDATVGGGVYENEPVERPDVVRGTDQVEEIMGQRGKIRNIAERFANQSNADNAAKRGPVPDMVVIERADGPSVLENTPTPVRPDVVRSEQDGDVSGPKVEPGMTRNLVACWKNKEFDSAQPSVSRPMELDMAKEAGVFENQPEVRTDVIRAVDEETEMISVTQTRSTRALWNQKEQDAVDGSAASRKYPREPVRFTPPREKTPPNVVQEDYRSYQTLTLSSSNTPGSTSPAPNSGFPASNHSSAGMTSPRQQQQLQPEEDSQPGATMTSSAVFVLKSC